MKWNITGQSTGTGWSPASHCPAASRTRITITLCRSPGCMRTLAARADVDKSSAGESCDLLDHRTPDVICNR